ncbi:MAG TPA: YqgE/AlgH family protein, partial [Vicinamibacteria bacterium]|nr:YqgE/AlgH family protein [Vicinamibacteria bacterium]
MPNDDLAPGLLLAAPRLNDPNFEKTVVLLGRHDDQGALGWVINGRELAPVAELLRASELFPAEMKFPAGRAFSRIACVGGPVAPATGWLVYRRMPDPLPGELELGAELAVTGEASAFNALVAGDGPSEFRLVLGCAGWAPGQLESEISAGAWLPAGLEVDLLFDSTAAS